MGMDKSVQGLYTTDMSARSAMLYLRTLRERHRLSRADIHRITGIEEKKLYRWEQEGKTSPDMSELGALARVVQASFRHLEVLLQEDDVSEAAVQAMADDRWEELQDPNATGVQEAIDLIAQLRAYPVLLGRLIEYGERLLDGAVGSR